jgi:DNA excision repair protein ERCC-3
MHIKPGIRVRDYQKIACEKIFWGPNKAHSGILVLPCGAGKTLIGINILALIKRPCVIFCQSSLAVTQWREQILNWTTVPPSKVMRFAGEFSSEWSPNPWVIISTYAMFSTDSSLYRSGQSLKWINYCKQNNWGLMILDEVHQAPAKIFKQVTAGFKTHLKLGLTATLVREDLGVQELPALVGPKLFELDIFTLRMKKHIAEVECHEIRCPMTPLCYAAHAQTADRAIQRLLYIMNLNKVRVCYNLVKFHLSHKRRIMLFCDDLFALRVYAQMLSNIIGRKVPSVDGKTENSLRESIVSNFRRAADGDVVLFSKYDILEGYPFVVRYSKFALCRVGDMSIDLPEADVVIQLAIIQGSRMQELQRIGRVQRPQAHKARAFFHSLVSDGTSEKGYAEHRRSSVFTY